MFRKKKKRRNKWIGVSRGEREILLQVRGKVVAGGVSAEGWSSRGTG